MFIMTDFQLSAKSTGNSLFYQKANVIIKNKKIIVFLSVGRTLLQTKNFLLICL